MRKDNRPSTLVEEAERLRSRAKMADDAVSTIATAAGLPADASAEEVVARVGEMRAIRDAAIADYHAENAKAAARRSLDATVEEVRDAGAEHIRCHQTLRRLAEEAGRA